MGPYKKLRFCCWHIGIVILKQNKLRATLACARTTHKLVFICFQIKKHPNSMPTFHFEQFLMMTCNICVSFSFRVFGCLMVGGERCVITNPNVVASLLQIALCWPPAELHRITITFWRRRRRRITSIPPQPVALALLPPHQITPLWLSTTTQTLIKSITLIISHISRIPITHTITTLSPILIMCQATYITHYWPPIRQRPLLQRPRLRSRTSLSIRRTPTI